MHSIGTFSVAFRRPVCEETRAVGGSRAVETQRLAAVLQFTIPSTFFRNICPALSTYRTWHNESENYSMHKRSICISSMDILLRSFLAVYVGGLASVPLSVGAAVFLASSFRAIYRTPLRCGPTKSTRL